MSVLSFNSLVCWQITLTLLHVSWIGLVIGLSAAWGNAALRNSTVNRRYWLNFASLLLFAASLPMTFAIVRGVTTEAPAALVAAETPVAELAELSPPVVEEPASELPPGDVPDSTPNPPPKLWTTEGLSASVLPPAIEQSTTSAWDRVTSIGHAAAPFVAILYAIGVALMFAKLAYGVRVSRKLRSASQAVTDATILARLAEQAQKVSLRITPVIAYCEHTAVPIVVGLLRPMILIPAAMVNGLTIEQLESVLTHELAHLRRRDHLMIVVQRVLEAILFFHPVTWYLSHRLHDDRETSCDDLVLSIGGDRLQYAQSLLRVAELGLAGQSHQKHIALAADGQRPSKLRLRIARLLEDSESDSLRVSSVWLLVTVLAFLIVGIASLSSTTRPVFAAIQDDAELDYEDVLELASKAYENPPPCATAHVKFRIAELNDGFLEGMTSRKCRQLLSESGVTLQPDKLRELLGSLIKEPNQLGAKPWSGVDLYQGQSGIRTTTSTPADGTDYWIAGKWSYRWDSAKSQASLLRREDDRFHKDETLDEFLHQRRMTFAWLKALKPISIRHDGDKILLQNDRNSELQQEATLDAVSGRIHSAANSFHGVVIGERLQLGWRAFNDDFWLPSVVAEFRYRRGHLDHCRFIVIEDASFNRPLPDGIFSFSVPAGSLISDKRVGLNQTYKINRDVADVTSEEQLEAAKAPLSEESAGIDRMDSLDKTPRDLAWLIAQVERNETLYANIDIHARFQYDHVGGQGKDVVASTESDHWFIQQGQRSYGRNRLRVTRNDGQRAPSTEAMVFDGQRTFLADDGIVTDSGEGLAGHNLHLFPHTLLYRVTSHGVPLSVYLRGTEAITSHPLSQISGSDRKAETVCLGVEQINGLTCHHVAVRIDGGLPSHDFWLAEDRNFLVLQKTSHSARSGSDIPSAKAMVDSFMEVAPGIWTPSRGRMDTFNKDLLRKNGEQVDQWSETFEVTAIDLNPMYSDEFFSKTILTNRVAADDAKGNDNRPDPE